MKTRNWIALISGGGRASVAGVGAAQKDEAKEVLQGYEESLKGREGIDPGILEKVAGLSAAETTDPGALTEVLRQLQPESLLDKLRRRSRPMSRIGSSLKSCSRLSVGILARFACGLTCPRKSYACAGLAAGFSEARDKASKIEANAGR